MMERNSNIIFGRFGIKKMEVSLGEEADFDKHEVVFVTPIPGKKNN